MRTKEACIIAAVFGVILSFGVAAGAGMYGMDVQRGFAAFFGVRL